LSKYLISRPAAANLSFHGGFRKPAQAWGCRVFAIHCPAFCQGAIASAAGGGNPDSQSGTTNAHTYEIAPQVPPVTSVAATLQGASFQSAWAEALWNLGIAEGANEAERKHIKQYYDKISKNP
jgi:hypothetical protein